MIYPTCDQLTKGQFNRYELVIGIAKSARKVTDEYVAQRNHAQKLIDDRLTDQSLAQLIAPEYRDQKAVKIAIQRLEKGEYNMVRTSEE
jgi:DNA-directed RNA polymerase subunit K/omega